MILPLCTIFFYLILKDRWIIMFPRVWWERGLGDYRRHGIRGFLEQEPCHCGLYPGAITDCTMSAATANGGSSTTHFTQHSHSLTRETTRSFLMLLVRCSFQNDALSRPWKVMMFNFTFLVAKLRKYIYIFKKINYIYSVCQLKIFTYALVETVLNYGIIGWGGPRTNHIKH